MYFLCCYVPTLRFDGFSDPWIKKTLSEVCDFLKGVILSKNDLSETGKPCILYGQLYTTYTNEIINEVLYKTQRKDKNLFYGKYNDVLIPASGETPEDIATACCVLVDNVIFGSDLNVLRTNHNGSFLSYQLNGVRRIDVAKLAVGKTIVHLHNEQLRKLSCFFPKTTEEEDKIVKLLDKIDKRIVTQNKIIKDLKELKKSICYSINLLGNIENKTVGEVCKIGRGRVISQREIEKQTNPIYPVYSSQTLNNGIMGYLDSYDFDGEYITWTTDGANAGTVFYHNGKFNCTNVCGTLKIIDNLVRPFYLYLLLELIAKKYVSKNLGNPKLMNGVMGDIQISIPSQLIQDKYVETIKTINDKIANENEILEHYYVMKRFLLKNLFI